MRTRWSRREESVKVPPLGEAIGVSPEGHWIFAYPTDRNEDGNLTLRAYSVDDGATILVTNLILRPQWSQDRTHVYGMTNAGISDVLSGPCQWLSEEFNYNNTKWSRNSLARAIVDVALIGSKEIAKLPQTDEIRNDWVSHALRGF